MPSTAQLVAEVMAPPARGRRPSGVKGAFVRELTPEDIRQLQNLPSGQLGSDAQVLKKLRHSHHSLARLIAEGVREGEASTITGYSLTYISTIKHDPAFKELVAYYAEQKSEVIHDVHQRLASVATDALEIIQEKMAEDPDSIPIKDLLEVAELGLDRTGHGPTSNHNHAHAVALVDAKTIQGLKADIASRQLGTVTPLVTSGHSRFTMGGAGGEVALAEGEIEGRESEGAYLPVEGGEVSRGDIPK